MQNIIKKIKKNAKKKIKNTEKKIKKRFNNVTETSTNKKKKN